MKKLALLAVVVGILAFANRAEAEFNLGGEKLSGFANFCWRSRYVASVGIQISDKPMLCQEASLKHLNSGVYGGVWLSQSVGEGRDGRDEKDFYLGIN